MTFQVFSTLPLDHFPPATSQASLPYTSLFFEYHRVSVFILHRRRWPVVCSRYLAPSFIDRVSSLEPHNRHNSLKPLDRRNKDPKPPQVLYSSPKRNEKVEQPGCRLICSLSPRRDPRHGHQLSCAPHRRLQSVSYVQVPPHAFKVAKQLVLVQTLADAQAAAEVCLALRPAARLLRFRKDYFPFLPRLPFVLCVY